MNEQLLTFFENNPAQYVSGEKLSQLLFCSRTAVWKHIQSLKKQGYIFAASPRLGYKLLQKPAVYDMPKFFSLLQTKCFGRSVHVYNQVDSTQNIAFEFVKQGAVEGTLILAEHQTAGRGRMGRVWHSPTGKGIWMSLILMPNIPLQFTSQLTLLVAVALCRTLQSYVSHQVGIKWPNDLLIRGRKVSGILLESSADDQRLNHVIAGIGISANLTETDFSEELRMKATSLLLESGVEVKRELLICHFLEQFELLYDLYMQQGFAPIRLLWIQLSVSLNRPLRIQTANGWLEGIAESIDEFGALILKQKDGKQNKLYSGDVELLI